MLQRTNKTANTPTSNRYHNNSPSRPGRPGEPPRNVASEAPGEPGTPGVPRGPAARGWCKTTPGGTPRGVPQGPGRASRGLREPRRGLRDPVPGSGILGIPRSLVWDPRPGREGVPRDPGTPVSGGVLHQPLAPGPRGSPPGVRDRGSPGTGFPGLPGGPRRHPAGVGLQTPSPRPPGNRGAPARGVDVKPPSPGGLGAPNPDFFGILRKMPVFRDFRDFCS